MVLINQSKDGGKDVELSTALIWWLFIHSALTFLSIPRISTSTSGKDSLPLLDLTSNDCRVDSHVIGLALQLNYNQILIWMQRPDILRPALSSWGHNRKTKRMTTST